MATKSHTNSTIAYRVLGSAYLEPEDPLQLLESTYAVPTMRIIRQPSGSIGYETHRQLAAKDKALRPGFDCTWVDATAQ